MYTYYILLLGGIPRTQRSCSVIVFFLLILQKIVFFFNVHVFCPPFFSLSPLFFYIYIYIYIYTSVHLSIYLLQTNGKAIGLLVFTNNNFIKRLTTQKSLIIPWNLLWGLTINNIIKSLTNPQIFNYSKKPALRFNK